MPASTPEGLPETLPPPPGPARDAAPKRRSLLGLRSSKAANTVPFPALSTITINSGQTKQQPHCTIDISSSGSGGTAGANALLLSKPLSPSPFTHYAQLPFNCEDDLSPFPSTEASPVRQQSCTEADTHLHSSLSPRPRQPRWDSLRDQSPRTAHSSPASSGAEASGVLPYTAGSPAGYNTTIISAEDSDLLITIGTSSQRETTTAAASGQSPVAVETHVAHGELHHCPQLRRRSGFILTLAPTDSCSMVAVPLTPNAAAAGGGHTVNEQSTAVRTPQAGAVGAGGGSYLARLCRLLSSGAVWLFLAKCFLLGFGSGLMGTFLFIYMTDLGASHALLGLMLTVGEARRGWLSNRIALGLYCGLVGLKVSRSRWGMGRELGAARIRGRGMHAAATIPKYRQSKPGALCTHPIHDNPVRR